MFWTNRNVSARKKAISTGGSFHQCNIGGRLFTCRPCQENTGSEQVQTQSLTICSLNPGYIILQGVLLDFCVNDVQQHMASKWFVDAPLIKWGHLLQQQDLIQPEMRPALSTACLSCPFHTALIWLCLLLRILKCPDFFVDFHRTRDGESVL